MSALMDALLAVPPWVLLLTVFGFPAVEASLFVGFVVPGELAVIIGGVAARGGSVPLWAVVVAAVAGAVVGDQVGYRIGRRYGPTLLERLPDRLSRHLDDVLGLLRRRGAWAVVTGRWLALLRAMVPGVAGASGMPAGRFTLANVAGGSVWAVAVAVAGYLAGAGYQALAHRLSVGGEILVGVVLVCGLVVLLVRHRRAHGPHEGTGA